jgi:hypothetical protein
MNPSGLAFTNVMYADDIMIFAKASSREVKAFDDCIEKYCYWLGQLINREKLGLIFSKLVTRERKRAIKVELNMKSISQQSIYLGAPLFTSRNWSKDFNFLQTRLESRLKDWRCKTLSWVGRCTLIKIVAQALPSYTFSSFDVPVNVCNKLDDASRRFWWNPKKEFGSFLAWKSWDSLCLPKGMSGLGFQKAKGINDAPLSKLTWMVLSNRESLCIQALRSKYKVSFDWLNCDPSKTASHTWKVIERLKCLVAKGACYKVGDGAIIDISKDHWVPWLPNFLPLPKDDSVNEALMVACLINKSSRT